MNNLSGKTAVVVGGSRGFGRGIVLALAERGARVVAVARGAASLDALSREMNGAVETIAADATDGLAAARIVEAQRPDVLVLGVGALGTIRPVRQHSWETFSTYLETDVKSSFLWAREALLLPLATGSTIFIVSSGAAYVASPVNASYAAAKAAQWMLTRCLAAEAAPLGIRVHGLLPNITPETDLGRDAIRRFARLRGLTEDQLMAQMGASGPNLTPAMVGAAVVSILGDAALAGEVGFKLTPAGAQPMSEVDPLATRIEVTSTKPPVRG